MDINEIIDKIKDIISLDFPNKKIFDKDVALSLSLSKESLSHMKKRNAIPFEQIAIFCAKRKISINWILFDQLPKSIEDETSKFTKIKYYTNINASAGGGGFNYDEDYELLNIDSFFLDSLYKNKISSQNEVISLNVIGDSMEPTLKDKEIIIIDRSMKDISKGGIFIVSTNAGLFVKRISQKLDGSIELISDNKTYNSEIISLNALEQVNLIGKVIGKIGLV